MFWFVTTIIYHTTRHICLFLLVLPVLAIWLLSYQFRRQKIYFQLQCDEEQAQYVLSESSGDSSRWKDYAIVFEPQKVHKPVAQLAGEIDEEFAYVIHEAADIVVVQGVCLDLLELDTVVLSVEDLLRSEDEKSR